MKLINVRRASVIHEFGSLSTTAAAVTCLVQSPALDVIAIGMSNGQCILHNIRIDQTVCSFEQHWTPVTAIAFRFDLFILYI
jgi:U3 small nucleolar RNA-associated protein 21